MKDSRTSEMLRAFGLSEKEAAAYLASLSLGTSSIAALAKKAGLKRPTAYLVVEELLAKGFLVSVPRGKKTYYKPEDPEKLHEQVEVMRRTLDTALAPLKEMYERQGIQPKIIFYDTEDGVRKLYERVFRSKEIWAMFSPDKFYEVFTRDDILHYFRLLDRGSGIIYDILEDTKLAREDAADPRRFTTSKVRFLPKGEKIATDTLVFQNAVVFVSFDALIGVLIEDKSIAATVKLLLKALWAHCEPHQ